MVKQFLVFLLRWVLSSFGLWVAVRVFGTGYQNVDVTAGLWGFLLAGLIFSIAKYRPEATAGYIVTASDFSDTRVIYVDRYGVLVYLSLLDHPWYFDVILNSILTGILLSLINYIVSAVVELRSHPPGE